MADARKYSDAEVRAILDRALSANGKTDGLSHEELLSVGEQVGISRSALSRAAHDLHEEQAEVSARRAVSARRRRWLGYHAALFALVNALAFLINFFTTPGEWWSLFSIVPWLFALIFHAGLNAAIPLSAGAIRRQRQRVAEHERAGASRLRVANSPGLRVGALPPPEPDEAAEGADSASKPQKETLST